MQIGEEMEKLKFKLISNNKEIINTDVAYYKKDNTIIFKIDNDLYKLDTKNIILTKIDKEKELVIKFKEKVIIIYAKYENITLDYPMLESIVKTSEKSINLSYTLEEDKLLSNTIVIEF